MHVAEHKTTHPYAYAYACADAMLYLQAAGNCCIECYKIAQQHRIGLRFLRMTVLASQQHVLEGLTSSATHCQLLLSSIMMSL